MSASIGSVANALFLPIKISSLQLWFDANDEKTLFDSVTGGSLVTTDAASVARWEDKSGNNRHATQSTLANRPLLKRGILNRKNIMRSSGSTGIKYDISYTLPTTHSIFIVLINGVQTSDSTSGIRVFFGSNALSNSDSSGLLTIGTFRTGITAPLGPDVFDTAIFTSRITTSAASLPVGVAKLISEQYDGSIIQSWINRVSYGTLNIVHSPFNNATIFGESAYPQRAAAGDIAEIIVYNRILSDNEKLSVESYLKTKWGI